MSIAIVPATMAHVNELARTINVEDRMEAEGMGYKANRLLWRSWKMSCLRSAGLVDGEVAAIWGVMGSFIGLTGVAWLVTGHKARTVPALVFTRIYRQEVRKMLEIFPRLENRVDATYTSAVKMLRLSGFQLGEPFPMQPSGRLYQLFYKEA